MFNLQMFISGFALWIQGIMEGIIICQTLKPSGPRCDDHLLAATRSTNQLAQAGCATFARSRTDIAMCLADFLGRR